MGISLEIVLVVISGISLATAVLIYSIGMTLIFYFGNLIKLYGSSLKDDLPADVCVDKMSGIDFCIRDEVGDVDLGSWMSIAGGLVLLTGSLIYAISLFGLHGGWKGRKDYVIVIIILIPGAIGLEAYLIHIMSNPESSFHDGARDDLLDKLKDTYEFANPPDDESLALTKAFNIFMLKGECCGVNGREDFGTNLSYVEGGRNHFYFMNPPACYRRELLIEKKYKLFCMQMDCKDLPDKNSENLINEKGCYDALYEAFYEEAGVQTYILAIFLIIWQIITAVISLTIVMNEKNQVNARTLSVSNQWPMQSNPRAAPPQTQSNQFQPFAKTSSFVDMEPNRTKSTQIW